MEYLTNDSQWILLRRPGPGSFDLEVLRIGDADWVTEGEVVRRFQDKFVNDGLFEYDQISPEDAERIEAKIRRGRGANTEGRPDEEKSGSLGERGSHAQVEDGTQAPTGSETSETPKGMINWIPYDVGEQRRVAIDPETGATVFVAKEGDREYFERVKALKAAKAAKNEDDGGDEDPAILASEDQDGLASGGADGETAREPEAEADDAEPFRFSADLSVDELRDRLGQGHENRVCVPS